MAAAIIHRLIHNSIIKSIKDQSYRLLIKNKIHKEAEPKNSLLLFYERWYTFLLRKAHTLILFIFLYSKYPFNISLLPVTQRINFYL